MESRDSVGAMVVVVLGVLDVEVVNVVDGAIVVVVVRADEVDDRVASSPEQPVRITASSAIVSGANIRFARPAFARSSLIESIVADATGCLRHNHHVSLQTEIAASHQETLIERLTGVHKAAPDSEGVDTPVSRVYAIFSVDVEWTSGLLDTVEAINTRLV